MKNDATGHLRGAAPHSTNGPTLKKPRYGDTTNKATAAHKEDLAPANIGHKVSDADGDGY